MVYRSFHYQQFGGSVPESGHRSGTLRQSFILPRWENAFFLRIISVNIRIVFSDSGNCRKYDHMQRSWLRPPTEIFGGLPPSQDFDYCTLCCFLDLDFNMFRLPLASLRDTSRSGTSDKNCQPLKKFHECPSARMRRGRFDLCRDFPAGSLRIGPDFSITHSSTHR
jgi:hypothetical protein